MDNLNKIYDAIKVRNNVYESKTMASWKKYMNGRSSYLIFLDNSKAVRQSIKKLNSHTLGQLDNDRRWKLQREIVKDLHNVLSSGQNFIDHLHYTHKFNDSVHEKSYSVFFRELRNYLVHNDAFKLVTKTEYKHEHGPRSYQAMDKSTFVKFVNEKGIKLFKKMQLEPSNTSKREQQLYSELLDLTYFLDERELFFDFEPVLDQYIFSLNKYYSKWLLSLLRKVTLANLKKFIEDMTIVNSHFFGSFSASRLRYLKLAFKKRSQKR